MKTFDKKPYDFAFIGPADFHHMFNLKDVRATLKSIHQHLRIGGALGLELWYPFED